MKVAVVTGSRADYGLLRPTLAALRRDPRFGLCLLVTAMHLDRRHGETLAEIEADGHPIAARVPTDTAGGDAGAAEGEVTAPEGDAGAAGDDAGAFARRLGHATVAFGDALAGCAPDVLLLLGDRFECLAAALAATGRGLPVAHLHGGELSEGSLDDALRHCITKLSHLHFVATRAHAERVCQLGEDPARVHVVGAAALESIRALSLLDRHALAQALALEQLPAPLVALTFHPASLDPQRAGAHTDAITGAVEDVLGGRGCVVVTLPNDDPGNVSVRERLRSWERRRGNVHCFAALGQLRYLSLLRHADVVLGNSSSAIIEASSFRVPVVNVGERQRGRLAPANVLGAEARRAAVAGALRRALDPMFRVSLADLENPYDHGDVSAAVLAALSAAPLEDLLHKRFFDLPDGPWRASLELARAETVVAGAGSSGTIGAPLQRTGVA